MHVGDGDGGVRDDGDDGDGAAVALFLLSDDAAYVTASRYFVDGGLSKR